MATSKKVKTVPAGFMGLTEAQNRLLLLGALCETPGRIDFSELANLAGITAASARTMYPKAKKKLEAFHAATAPSGTSITPLDATLDVPVSVKKSPAARSYKKRKIAEATTADEDLSYLQEDGNDAKADKANENINTAEDETGDGQPAEHDTENDGTDDAEPTEPTDDNDEI